MLKPSYFTEKAVQPSISDVEKVLTGMFHLWKELMDYIDTHYPEISEEWCHSGKKYGWSFRLRSKKRVVMYFTPLEGSFRVAFALGQAAVDAVLAHPDVPFEWKKELLEATVYMEGRGLRIGVNDSTFIPVIKEIIKIKMNH